jgi:tetratricopeptide (TPR) repeat protein
MQYDKEIQLEKRFERGTSPTERQRIEREADAELRDEIEAGRRIRAALAHGERPRLKALLEEEERSFRKAPVMTVWVRRAMAAAAVLLPLLWFFWPANDPFSPYENRLSAMGASNQIETTIQTASKAYDTKDYATAATLFGQLATALPDESQYAFYQANALMADKKYALALPIWERLLTTTREPYASEAHWYLALTQRELGNHQAARTHLQTYSQRPAGVFRGRVEEVLKTLK